MTIVMTAGIVAILLFLILMFTRRSLSLRRCVLLHAPAPLVWRHIKDFPQLLAGHGRGRLFGAFGQHAFINGDPHHGGSVWRTRGTWAGAEYWVDAELIRIEAGKEIVIRLVRDSLQTHRALRRHKDHIARLTLKPNGSGTSKLTWDLQARFLPTGLLWHRHFNRAGLNARLLDICLRSVKVDIDNAISDPGVHPGDSKRPVDDPEDASSRAIVISPPDGGPEKPPLQLH